MHDNEAAHVRPMFISPQEELDNALMARAWALPREFGKCNTEVKVWLPADAVKELELVTKALCTTKGEFARFLILRELFGKERVRIINPYLRQEVPMAAFQAGTATSATEPEQLQLETRS